MRRTVWIRRLALIVGGLLLLFAVAAAVLVATFDANRYKGLVVDWVRAEYQRSLAIDGPIELSVLPRLAVKVSKLRLGERANAAEFAAVDEAALALQWWPLLSQRLVVDSVSARGVRAVYSRNAQGVSNIDDLLKPRDTNAKAAPATDQKPRFGVDIRSITLENLQLRLRDDLAKRAGEIDVQRFRSGRLASAVETPLELKASVKLTQPQPLQLALDGGASVALNFQTMAVTARDLKLELQGDAAGLQGLVVQLAAKGLAHDPAARRLQLDALVLNLNGRVNGRADGQPLEAALDWPRLAIDGDRLEGSALSGRIKRAGPDALTASFRSEAPSGSFEALRLPGFALAFNGNAGPRKFDGKARTDLLLRPSQGAYALERFELSATLEQAGTLTLTLRGQATGDAKAAQWGLDGALAGNRFESKGSAAFG
ncbi:MAG: AsmA family protein, partial [Burkholderiaceae bacterium]